MRKHLKPFLIIISALIAVILLIAFTYLKFIPFLVSNDKFINFAENKLEDITQTQITINKPVLITSTSPVIEFAVKNLKIEKDKKELLNVQNFETKILFKKILEKKIMIKKLGADYIFADVNGLSEITFGEETTKEEKKSDWKVGLFSSLLYIKDCLIIYQTDDGLNFKLQGKNIEIEEQRNPKSVKFNFLVDMEKNNQKFKFKLDDNNTVFTNEKKLYAQNTEFYINNSKILINYVGKEDKSFEVNLHSKNFDFNDVSKLINSNIFIPNGSDLLAMTQNINGKFDFNMNINNAGLNGNVKINKLAFTVPLVNNLPVTIQNGDILLTKNDIKLNNFNGYQGKNINNKFDFKGDILNYTSNPQINIVSYVDLSKEFTNGYFSKMINYPVELVGKTKAQVKFNMKDNIIISSVIFRLKKGCDILVDGLSLTPTAYERAFKTEVKLNGNNLELTDLNYYIAKSFTAGVKAKPILQVKGNFDLAKDGAIKNLGFEIPKPLPSEFLNVLLREKVFKEGKIAGKLEFIATSNIPYLKGNLSMEKVKIPSQRMIINKAELKAENKNINLISDGRYKRATFNFKSSVLNEIKTPFIIKDISLKVDNVDIERIMRSFANQPQQGATDIASTLADTKENEAKSDEEVTINTDFIVIEHGLLEVVKGVYKQINFGNVKATLTLDKNGVLDIHSNRFDIAEGISSAKINCDLKNQKYTIKLGIKDVNSDVIATSILNLPREISGKARGFINLETDKTFKLNGTMKFDIKDGNIAKVGLIEYALNFVSLFRNPLAMISPATFFDIVNIPEGDFDWIKGDIVLKDNSIDKMMIKSSAPQLSSFIVGRYDLEKSDATLRIYTKFSKKNKGIAGALRYISLSALANKMPLNSRNDSNYYSAEISLIPPLSAGENENDYQVFLTKVDGDVEHNNFLSTLKRIK